MKTWIYLLKKKQKDPERQKQRGWTRTCHRSRLVTPDPSHWMMKVTLLLFSSSHFVIVNLAWNETRFY